MPFVPVANTAQAEIRYELDGQRVENTLWFEWAAAPTSTDLAQLASDLFAWAQANILPVCSNQLALKEVYVTDQTTQMGPVASYAPSSSPVGGDIGNPVPNNVALCVSFRTASRGRSYRGRNYIAGITMGWYSSNEFLPGGVNPIVNGYQLLYNGTTIPYATWVVASRYSGNMARAAGVTTPVTRALAIDSVVDSQRRRLPKRGI